MNSPFKEAIKLVIMSSFAIIQSRDLFWGADPASIGTNTCHVISTSTPGNQSNKLWISNTPNNVHGQPFISSLQVKTCLPLIDQFLGQTELLHHPSTKQKRPLYFTLSALNTMAQTIIPVQCIVEILVYTPLTSFRGSWRRMQCKVKHTDAYGKLCQKWKKINTRLAPQRVGGEGKLWKFTQQHQLCFSKHCTYVSVKFLRVWKKNK